MFGFYETKNTQGKQKEKKQNKLRNVFAITKAGSYGNYCS